MRYVILLLVLSLLSNSALADVGPSPSYTFTISNMGNYPGYRFYYAGVIWPEKLEPVTSETSVYKLNTHITLYAVPFDVAPKGDNPPVFSRVVGESVVSDQYDLKPGHTVFHVIYFDSNSRQMRLSTVSRKEPDVSLWDSLYFGLPLLVIMVVVVGVGLVGLLVLAFVVKILVDRKKKKE
ncbi:MAG: hypothetical protein ABIH11_07285 [Candidatus Altiarchaeota archaeon]